MGYKIIQVLTCDLCGKDYTKSADPVDWGRLSVKFPDGWAKEQIWHKTQNITTCVACPDCMAPYRKSRNDHSVADKPRCVALRAELDAVYDKYPAPPAPVSPLRAIHEERVARLREGGKVQDG